MGVIHTKMHNNIFWAIHVEEWETFNDERSSFDRFLPKIRFFPGSSKQLNINPS